MASFEGVVQQTRLARLTTSDRPHIATQQALAVTPFFH